MSRPAKASLVWGILGCTLLPVAGGCIALYYGMKARREPRAVAGMLLGAVSVGFAPLWLSLILPALSEAGRAAGRAACADNLRQVMLAARAYRAQCGCPPPSARALLDAGQIGPRDLRCPAGRGDDYELLPLDPARVPPHSLLVYHRDPMAHAGLAPSGLADGSVAHLWFEQAPLQLALSRALLAGVPPP